MDRETEGRNSIRVGYGWSLISPREKTRFFDIGIPCCVNSKHNQIVFCRNIYSLINSSLDDASMETKRIKS